MPIDPAGPRALGATVISILDGRGAEGSCGVLGPCSLLSSSSESANMSRVNDLIKRLGASFGVDVQRLDHTLQSARTNLFKRLRTNLVIDVGANRGQYFLALRRSGYAGRVISFEPLPTAYAELKHLTQKHRNWDVRCVALAEHSGKGTMHVSENLASSSLLAVTDESVRAAPTTRISSHITVPVSTLDAELELDAGDQIHLKLDTQGSELRVLLGALGTLPRVASIECELSLVSLYEGQPLLHEVFEYLYDNGFVACCLERGLKSTSGDLLQVDGLFLRRTHEPAHL